MTHCLKVPLIRLLFTRLYKTVLMKWLIRLLMDWLTWWRCNFLACGDLLELCCLDVRRRCTRRQCTVTWKSVICLLMLAYHLTLLTQRCVKLPSTFHIHCCCHFCCYRCYVDILVLSLAPYPIHSGELKVWVCYLFVRLSIRLSATNAWGNQCIGITACILW